MTKVISMHEARTALNRDPELRQWAEQWLKEKERSAQPSMTEEEFQRHWKYVRPEKMHEGSIEAVTAHQEQQKK
jgi:hypothetical protein